MCRVLLAYHAFVCVVQGGHVSQLAGRDDGCSGDCLIVALSDDVVCVGYIPVHTHLVGSCNNPASTS